MLHHNKKILFMYNKHKQKKWINNYPFLDLQQGKVRMFELGKHFRERYKHFLTYNPREVQIRSSDVDRCLESTALIMAAAYPPKDKWKWTEEINWQPFPIHTVSQNEDGVRFQFTLFNFIITTIIIKIGNF